MLTILIVEDEQPVRALLAQLLTGDGYQARVAVHGAQALEMMAKERPDLVLSDVMMPLMGGAELCRRLKHEPATAGIPVILMTSAGRAAADGTGCDAFIAKPFDLNEIEDLVRRWLPEVHAK